jgi:hypothetical protein
MIDSKCPPPSGQLNFFVWFTYRPLFSFPLVASWNPCNFVYLIVCHAMQH